MLVHELYKQATIGKIKATKCGTCNSIRQLQALSPRNSSKGTINPNSSLGQPRFIPGQPKLITRDQPKFIPGQTKFISDTYKLISASIPLGGYPTCTAPAGALCPIDQTCRIKMVRPRIFSANWIFANPGKDHKQNKGAQSSDLCKLGSCKAIMKKLQNDGARARI